MSAIEKIAVFDPRIVQEPPVYGVNKGALSVSVSPFSAISASANQHTYQVLVPSLNVFVDRKIQWSAQVYVQMQCAYTGFTTGGTAPASSNGTSAASGTGTVICIGTSMPSVVAPYATMCQPGKDFTLCQFPLQSLCTNMTASINDCVVTTNGDTLREQILLSSTRENLKMRTTTTKFDKYAWNYDDALQANTGNGNFNTYSQSHDFDVPNGSWPITFVYPQGASSVTISGTTSVPSAGSALPILSAMNHYTDANGTNVWFFNGVPVWRQGEYVGFACPSIAAAPTVAFSFASVEPLILSPFSWADSAEMTTVGLYGCTNLAFTMNLQSPSSAASILNTAVATAWAAGTSQAQVSTQVGIFGDNLLQTYPSGAALVRFSGVNSTCASCALMQAPSSSYGPFTNPKLNVTFLTPGPDVSLPLVSNVPYMEFPRYFTNISPSGGVFTSGLVQMASQTITLSSIPDILAVWVKPTSRGCTQGETYMPISNIGVTFDNFSNLCSNFSQQNLYDCSVAAGLDMDWHQFRGWTEPVQFGSFPTNTTLAGSFWGTTVPASAAAAKGFNVFQSQTSAPVVAVATGLTQLTGGPLLLRMGQDVSLSPGLAPGCLGNYSVQLNITVDNTAGFFNYVSGCTIWIMAVSSGYFETVRGQSAIRKTILNTADVEAAHTEAGMTVSHLNRMVGRGGRHPFAASAPAMGAAVGVHRRMGMLSGGPPAMGAKRFRASASGLA